MEMFNKHESKQGSINVWKIIFTKLGYRKAKIVSLYFYLNIYLKFHCMRFES
jgi:hypothetical protein